MAVQTPATVRFDPNSDARRVVRPALTLGCGERVRPCFNDAPEPVANPDLSCGCRIGGCDERTGVRTCGIVSVYAIAEFSGSRRCQNVDQRIHVDYQATTPYQSRLIDVDCSVL